MSLFGRKNKSPYKIPQEVKSLRGRIDLQLRENFPNLAQYQELAKETEIVFRQLNAAISGNEHAEEAARLRDDLKARLSRLAAKIKKNRREGEDLKEDEIDSLRRKTLRTNAKSLFTDLVEQVELLKKCCLGGHVGHGQTLDSIAQDIVRTIAALNSNFFTKHASDVEIDGLKRDVLQMADQLNGFLDQNRPAISTHSLETKAAMAIMKITTAINIISPTP